MKKTFFKYEALGNDFVIWDCRDGEPEPGVSEAVRLCDRHRGVGADGVLVLQPSDSAWAKMKLINSDGSISGMCGNGLRCVALYAGKHLGAGDQLVLESGHGLHTCRLLDADEVSGDLDAPRFQSPEFMPALWDGKPGSVNAGGTEHAFSALSLGNPHAVFFEPPGGWSVQMREDVADALLRENLFPQGVNVSFVQILKPGGLKVAVKERGAGWTLACGSGACASVVVATLQDKIPRGQVTQVDLPGGSLQIAWTQSGLLEMTGPVNYVFTGQWEPRDP